MAEIVVEGLSKTYRGSTAVSAIQDACFKVDEGEMLVLLGPSGCGKSTTLRCIAGLERPDSGEIRFADRVIFSKSRRVDVPSHRRDVGLVFQTFALWPHLTVRKNIEFPLRTRRVPRLERHERVDAVASLVDLGENFLEKYPGTLSGGQQQRVSLARALVGNPRVVLFDEPLSNLDAALREQVQMDLRILHRRLGFTGIYVTHDLREAYMLGDRIAVMGNGKIEQVGAPHQVMDRPATATVARLLGLRRLCRLTQTGNSWVADSGVAGGDLPAPVEAPQSLDLYARPECVIVRPRSKPLDSGLSLAGGRIEETVQIGQIVDLVVSIGTRRVRLTSVADGAMATPLAKGDDVVLWIANENARLFDDSGRGWLPPDAVWNGSAPHPVQIDGGVFGR